MSSNLKVNSLVPATGTEIGIGTTGGTIDFRCPATFGGNVTIGGTLTYDEVINIDSIGIVTARSGLKVTGGQLDVGSNIKLGNAGVVTATSFVGGLPITSGADNRVITASSASAIQGETNLTYDGTNMLVNGTMLNAVQLKFGNSGLAYIDHNIVGQDLQFRVGNSSALDTNALRITSGGQLIAGSTNAATSALISIVKNTTEVLADNEPLYNNASPAFLTVYNSNNTGSGEEAGINIVPAGNANGAISIYGKKTGSYAGDLIFRFRSGASTSAERLRLDSNGRLSFAGDTDTYIWHPQADQLAITKGGASFPIIRFGSGGSGGTVAIGNTTANLVTNGEILSVRGYSSFKSTNNGYAAIYTHNEGNTSGTFNTHILFNAGGANRGGIGYMPNTGELTLNHQYDFTIRTGAAILGGTERLRITSAGATEVKGDLYVKTTYPRIYLLDTNSNSDYSIINDNGTFSVYDDTASGFRLRITNNGALGTTSTVRSANGGLDLCSQGATDLGTLTLGASGGQNGQNRSANTENQFRIMSPTYADPSKMFTVMYGASGSSMHEINYGGGTGWAYAANQHRFFTAANKTTGTGTERLIINADGTAKFSTSQVHLYNNVNTSNTYFYAQNTSAGNAGIKLKNNQGEWTIIANDRLRFIDDDAGLERLSILSDGRLSINDSSPNSNETLTIQPVGNIACDVALKLNNSNDSRIKFYDSGGTHRGGLAFTEYANSTEYPNFHDSFYMLTDPGSNGTLEVAMRVNNNGCFIYPKQPCFSVYMSSDYTSGTSHTANFNGERFDQGNNFNTGSNGIFTAPVTGKYFMHAVIQTRSGGDNQTHIMGVSFAVNGSVNNAKGSGDQYWGRDDTHYMSVHNTRILNLAQGDTVQVNIQLHGSVNIEGSGGTDRCNWQGYLIG